MLRWVLSVNVENPPKAKGRAFWRVEIRSHSDTQKRLEEQCVWWYRAIVHPRQPGGGVAVPTDRSAFRPRARRGEDMGVRRERVRVPRSPSTVTGDRCGKQRDRSWQRGLAPQPPQSPGAGAERSLGAITGRVGALPRSEPSRRREEPRQKQE